MSPARRQKTPATRKRLPLIAVRKGQVYSYKPPKKGAHTKYVLVVGVQGRKSPQPKATYRQMTRSSKLVKPKKSEPVRTWLSWNGQQWVFPFGELVT